MTDQTQAQPGLDLENTAHALAKSHQPKSAPLPELDLYRRLEEMPLWLDMLRKYCADPDPSHSRAADWLQDNDYQILRAIRRVREDLPESFFKRLPILENAQEDRVPRIFDVAHSFFEVTQFHVSLRTLVRYMIAYQDVSGLSIAELWAFPSMLRLACLEVLADAFHQLNADLAPPFEITVHMGESRADDPTDRISRAIVNLGVIHSITWRDFFDQTSQVEAILKDDPGEIYAQMDFDTRDRYRKTIEELAAGSKQPETEVAQQAINLSRTSKDDLRRGHVGFWLVDNGRPQFDKALQLFLRCGLVRSIFARPHHTDCPPCNERCSALGVDCRHFPVAPSRLGAKRFACTLADRSHYPAKAASSARFPKRSSG